MFVCHLVLVRLVYQSYVPGKRLQLYQRYGPLKNLNISQNTP